MAKQFSKRKNRLLFGMAVILSACGVIALLMQGQEGYSIKERIFEIGRSQPVLPSGCSDILHNRLQSDVRYGAILYATDLKDKGALPGVAPKDHGEMILDDGLGVLAHTGIAYPLEVTVRVRNHKDAKNVVFAYLFLKASPDVEWKLVGACKRVKGKNVWYMNSQEIDALSKDSGSK
jgi:hypothetical protein